MKTLKELKGVKVLNKKEQKQLAGGFRRCSDGCFPGWCCSGGMCVKYDTQGFLCTPPEN